MEVYKQDTASIIVVNEEVKILQDIFIKLATICRKPGFKKDFNLEEVEMINVINKELNGL